MFTYEVKQHKKDGHEYIEITDFEGTVSELKVPDKIDGINVEAIGNHAFSGRQDIITIVLPETIKTLYGFAFHNCRKLKKITLFDSLDDYYDGVCRQCDSLEEIDITIKRSWYEVIRNFLADNDKTLKFFIHNENEGQPKEDSFLTFPEYVYDFNENTMARTIQFTIAGAGMSYRECVDRRKIDYRQYDSLFNKAVIDGSQIARSIATGRLLYPVELDDNYRKVYEAFLREKGAEVLESLLKEYDKAPEVLHTFEKLLDYSCAGGEGLFAEKDIESAIKLSTSLGTTVMGAVLMDKNHSKPQTASEGFFL